MLYLRILAAPVGLWLIFITISAAIRSFVLPRNETVRLNVGIYSGIRLVFDLVARSARNYAQRDRVLAHYAPVALVALPICWEALVGLGYTGIYWALGEGNWGACYRMSSSYLLTLGTDKLHGTAAVALGYSEASLGLLLLTLLLSYLPTIYQAFSRREVTVARLELRAGTPATAVALLVWLHRNGALDNDAAQWADWEQWFVEIEESHTSLPILTFFRSPQPGRSWVTAGGLVLDAANLLFSALDTAHGRQVELTFKAGCLALNRVYRFFDLKVGSEPSALLPDNDPLEAPGRADFLAACDELAAAGLPLCPDRAAAWQHYLDRRQRYAPATEFLARLTMAPDSKPV